jgi:hypothetical protein
VTGISLGVPVGSSVDDVIAVFSHAIRLRVDGRAAEFEDLVVFDGV